MTRAEIFNDYEGFLQKFEAKKTTDDCYTPEWLYRLVLDYIDANILPLEGVNIVRPFWPGADYRDYDYQPGDVVIDNPPFSIATQVVNWYLDHGIRFWLWAPALTIGGIVQDKPVTAVICGCNVTYANGAQVSTSFVTNLIPDLGIWCAGDLARAIIDGNKQAIKAAKPSLPRIDYPDGCVTGARLQKIANAGVDLKVAHSEMRFVRHLDRQQEAGKAMFGAG